MPSRQDYLLARAVIVSDRAALNALKDIDAYAPRNPDYSTATLGELEAALSEAERAVAHAQRALDTARHRLIQAAWGFHNGVLGAKSEIITQFGPDSFAVHAIGLRRKSDRKPPSRRRGPPPA